MKKVIYCLALLLPLWSHAEVQKLLDITCQSDADLLSVMAIDVRDQNKISGMVYTPDANDNETKIFTTEQLLEDRVTLKSEKGVEVVGVKLKQIDQSNFVVTLHYLYKFKLLNRTYKDKQLNVTYSAPDNRYLVQDDETKKMISKLHFLSNYNDKGKEVGIEKIETL